MIKVSTIPCDRNTRFTKNGKAYQKTNTIFTSTAIHMIHNTTLILISILPTLLK